MHVSFFGAPTRAVDDDGASAHIVSTAPPHQQERMAVLGDSCSLRLDGFTTWVEVSGSAHHQEAIRAEAWFAPRASRTAMARDSRP